MQIVRGHMGVKICYKHARLQELHVFQAYHDMVGSNDESLCGPCTRHHHDMMRYKRFQHCSTCSKLIVSPKFKCMKLMAMEQSCHALCLMFLLLFPRGDLTKNCYSRCRNGMLATNICHWSWNHNSFTCVHRSIDPSIHLGPTWCGCRSSKCICALQVGQCPTAPEVCNFSSESSRVSDACSWNKATWEWWWYE